MCVCVCLLFSGAEDDSSFSTPAAAAADSALQDRRWTAAPALACREGTTYLSEQVLILILIIVYYLCVCLCLTRQEVDSAAGSVDASKEEAIRNTTTSPSSCSSSSTYYSYSSFFRQTQNEINADTEESRPLLDADKNNLGGRSESRKLIDCVSFFICRYFYILSYAILWCHKIKIFGKLWFKKLQKSYFAVFLKIKFLFFVFTVWLWLCIQHIWLCIQFGFRPGFLNW